MCPLRPRLQVGPVGPLDDGAADERHPGLPEDHALEARRIVAAEGRMHHVDVVADHRRIVERTDRRACASRSVPWGHSMMLLPMSDIRAYRKTTRSKLGGSSPAKVGCTT